jgi:peptidoglycan/xylan/chitin deacetylase (PgdA/CDA1 family)
MTPANYEMFRAFFNVKLSKQQISKVMKERYLWLIKNGQRVQLHAHLTKLMNISYQEQEKLIRNSVEWFTKNLGFFPKEFVPGWWAYNKDTEKILSKLNIRLIKEEEFRATHDYNWIMN